MRSFDFNAYANKCPFCQATETTAQVFLQHSVNAGMGRHLDDLSNSQIVTALHWSWVFQLLAITASMLGKLAILAFLLQIRGRHEKKPWFLIILGVLIGAINTTALGTILGQCKPMNKLWDDSVEGTCNPGRKVNQNYSFFQGSEFSHYIKKSKAEPLLTIQASTHLATSYWQYIQFISFGSSR